MDSITTSNKKNLLILPASTNSLILGARDKIVDKPKPVLIVVVYSGSKDPNSFALSINGLKS